MRSPGSAIKSLLALLSIAGCFWVAPALDAKYRILIEAGGKNQFDLLRAAKTVSIVVKEDYPGIKGVSLPFAAMTAKLFKYAGIKAVTSTAAQNNFTVNIKVTGRALWADYHSIGRQYLGADLQGAVSFQNGPVPVYENDFRNLLYPPQSIFVAANLKYTSSPKGAPFDSAFRQAGPGCFIPLLAEMIGTVYDVQPLLAALGDPDNDFRASVVTAFGQLKETRNVNVIIPLLKDPSGEVREAAAAALGTIQDRRAVEPLINTVQDDSWRVRAAAIRALGYFKDPGTVAPLLTLLQTEDLAVVRREIITALGATGDNRAIKPVLTALKDENLLVRNAAAGAVGELKIPNAVELLLIFMRDKRNLFNPKLPVMDPAENPDLRATAAQSVLKAADSKAVPVLIAALKDQDPLIRLTAARALGNTKDSQAAEPLIAVLTDPDPQIREAAVDSLGETGDLRAVEPLTGILKTPDTAPSIRSAAIQALGCLKDSRAIASLLGEYKTAGPKEQAAIEKILRQIDEPYPVQPLAAVLTDRDVNFRRLAAENLERLQWAPADEAEHFRFLLAKQDWPECVKAGQPIVPLLIDFITDADREIREKICDTLGKIKDPQAIPALGAALKDKNSKVRRAAAQALTALEWKPQNEDQQIAFYIALNQLLDCVKYGASALDSLIGALEDDDPVIRLNAARALCIINDPQSVEPLIASLHYADNDSRIRKAAVIGLGRSKDRRAYEPLLAVLDNEPDREVRKAAIIGLGDLGDQRAAESLLKILSEPEFRAAAATALGLLKDSEAVEPLLKCLEEDPDPETGSAIIRALGELPENRAVEPLTSIYQDPNNDLQLRCAAIQALGRINDPSSLETIVTSLSDREWEIRIAGAEAVENMDPIAGADLFVALLSSPNSFARKIAAGTLARLEWTPRDEEEQVTYCIADQNWNKCISLGKVSVQPLLQALKDEDWKIRLEAIHALGRINDPQAVTGLSETLNDPANRREIRLAAIEALGRIQGDQALASLMLALYDSDLALRKKAAAILGEIKDSRATDPLIMIFKDPQSDLELRLIILKALGKIKDSEAVESLIVSLSDSNPLIRKVALTELLNIKDPHGTEFIIKGLRDTDPHVRAMLAEELIQLSDQKLADGQIAILIAALNDSSTKMEIKREIIRILARIDDPKVITPLIDALKDPELEVKKEAAKALQAMADPQILEPLAVMLDDPDVDTRKVILPVLGGIKKSRAVEILIAALKDENPELRETAVNIIQGITETYAALPLINTLNDPDPEIRLLAIDTLGKTKDPRAVIPLIKILQQKKNDREIRLHTVEALGGIGDRQAVKPLITALKEKDYAFRIAVCEALGGIKDYQAIEPLINVLKDKYAKEWFVNAEAARALTEITGEDFGVNYQDWKNWWRKNKKEFKITNFE